MNNQKSGLISKGLIALALLLFLISTFCFFGAALKIPTAVSCPNMFAYMFGNDGMVRLKGMTALFVFQMIVVLFTCFVIFGTVTKRTTGLLNKILLGVICLCSFIALIISFCAKNICLENHSGIPAVDVGLGAGPISYSILHILSLLSCGASVFLSRKGL